MSTQSRVRRTAFCQPAPGHAAWNAANHVRAFRKNLLLEGVDAARAEERQHVTLDLRLRHAAFVRGIHAVDADQIGEGIEYWCHQIMLGGNDSRSMMDHAF